jgi:hypothetical protein
MARKTEVSESNTTKSKMLVNVGEHRKRWLEAVAEQVPDGSVTEVMRCNIDTAMVEDPESYAGRVIKWRVKAQLEEIERAEEALKARKADIVRALEGKGELQAANER